MQSHLFSWSEVNFNSLSHVWIDWTKSKDNSFSSFFWLIPVNNATQLTYSDLQLQLIQTINWIYMIIFSFCFYENLHVFSLDQQKWFATSFQMEINISCVWFEIKQWGWSLMIYTTTNFYFDKWPWTNCFLLRKIITPKNQNTTVLIC